ncbi:hypothetical protein ABVK25_004016 [Lepraria finkii]|uniref:Uncharacterized protein n=1 Tax=Lepraria finkii TaxID=1340010 RepID=A0ABR4BED4_9LECA
MTSIGKKSACFTCQGATWHGGSPTMIPYILDVYPKEEWCVCQPAVNVEGVEYPPEGKKADGWGKRKRELLRLTRDKRVRWARSFGMMGPGGVGMGPGI